jgi:hypothetical protein
MVDAYTKLKKITWADMTPEERRSTQILAETIDERLSKAVNRMFTYVVIILAMWAMFKLFWPHG